MGLAFLRRCSIGGVLLGTLIDACPASLIPPVFFHKSNKLHQKRHITGSTYHISSERELLGCVRISDLLLSIFELTYHNHSSNKLLL